MFWVNYYRGRDEKTGCPMHDNRPNIVHAASMKAHHNTCLYIVGCTENLPLGGTKWITPMGVITMV